MTAVHAVRTGGARRFTLRPRHLWLIPGLAVAFLASGQAEHHGLGLVPVLLFGIAPHLTVLLGYGQPHGPGRLVPRAIGPFNVMHHPALPLTVLGLGAMGILSPFWLVGALAWLSHIVIDLALGDGLRTPGGAVRPWRIGGAA